MKSEIWNEIKKKTYQVLNSIINITKARYPLIVQNYNNSIKQIYGATSHGRII